MFNYGFPKDWSTLKKLAFLRGSALGGGGSYITLVGDIVRFMASRSAPFRKLQIALEPIQDLNGYDSPWPAGGGKNLLDPDERTNSTQNIYFYQANGFLLKENQTYIFSVYSSENAAGLYIHKLSDNSNLAVKYNSKTVTYTPTEDVLAWFDAYYSPSPTGGTANINVQLELGSTATAWTPYSNICPITGWTGANVTRTGKNLLDPTGSTVAGSTYFVGAQNGNTFNYYLKAGTYTLSEKWSGEFGYSYWRQKGTNANNIIHTYADNKGTFTLPADDYYRFWYYGNSMSIDRISDIQLELGSTASAYEPYSGNTYTIQLGDTVYGGTLDVTAGKLTVTKASADLGTLDWVYSYGRPNAPLVGIKPSANGSSKADLVCTAYKNLTPNEWYAQDTPGIASLLTGYIGNGIIGLCDPNYTDAQALKTALSGVRLVYELATPIEITLTPQTINSLVGENNVWDDGTVTVEVKGEAIT